MEGKKNEANELCNNHSHIHSIFKIIRDMYYLMVYTHCALKNKDQDFLKTKQTKNISSTLE